MILQEATHTEVVVWKCSVKKVFLKVLQNSQENTNFRVSLFIDFQAEACNFIKKENPTQVFYCKFSKILKKNHFI